MFSMSSESCNRERVSMFARVCGTGR